MIKKILLVSGTILVMIATVTACAKTTQTPALSEVDNIELSTSNTSKPLSTTNITIPLQPELSNFKITETEAITIASQYVPQEVVSAATIHPLIEGSGNYNTGENNYYWEVIFLDISITKTELGWQPDSQTIIDSEGPYNELIVRVDPMTGGYISREAFFGQKLGPTTTK